MPMGLLCCSILTLCLLTTCLADAPSAPEPANVVLENQYLRVEVTPVGARIVSVVDKLRGGEQVRMTPYVGGLGEVRFNGVINHSDLKNQYLLTYDAQAASGPTVTAVTAAPADDDNPVAATVSKTYTLVPDSGRIRCTLTLRNEGTEAFALMPWVRNLLNRGLKAQPEEAHMTPHGAYLSGRPVPGRPDLDPRRDNHYFPAGNWTSRVTQLEGTGSNTLVSILSPAELLKVFNWHRALESFCTQEFIAAPLFIEPGQTQTLRYEMVLTAPVQNIVYASPLLVVGASPHPTGLPADTRQLELDFTAPQPIADVEVTATLCKVDAPDQPLHTATFALSKLDPAAVVRQSVPVELTANVNYQLRLTFTHAGAAWQPGAPIGDTRPVVIPLVVGAPITPQVVYASEGTARDRLLRIQPRRLTLPRVLEHPALSVYAASAGMRVFPEDRCEPQPDGDALLRACRNEYESVQLVLTPTAAAPAQVRVRGGDLLGPDGSRVRCDSANQLLEVNTSIPSRYDASYRIGTYREGLLPTQSLQLAGQINVPLVMTYYVPADAAPGQYRGEVELAWDSATVKIPVAMEVWDITLPRSNPWMDTPTSLKGIATGGVVVRGADGQPLTNPQLLDAVVDLHLKYRLTPCDAGITNHLLALNFEKFEPVMQHYVDQGATKIFLGNITKLLPQYAANIPKVESYLRAKGWIDHFYVRAGFDEASPDLLDQIQERCAAWKAISSIPIMETYYHDEPRQLYGLIDIYCRSVSDQAWIRERMAAGDRFWRVNAFPQVVEIEPWLIRPKYLNFWEAGFTGTYLWTIKQWHAVAKWYEDFWCDGGVGNLSATLIWPHETGLLSSLGLEALRDALEDNTLFWMLREKVNQLQTATNLTPAQQQALAQARAICADPGASKRLKNVADLLALRERAGTALSVLNGVDATR